MYGSNSEQNPIRKRSSIMNDPNRFAENLLQFYDQHARELPFRVSPRPYYTWISEIMLQQTRMDTVIPYFNRFIEAVPDIPALAQIGEEQLMKLWEGLGYYSRARNLKKAAQMMVELHHGNMPETFEELVRLPGIGPYTAGAIASIAFGKPVPAVDGNVIRVFSRLEAFGDPVMNAKGRQFIHSSVERVISKTRPGDFNQAVMDLGATICLPNGAPLCGQCPVAGHCLALTEGDPLAYPVMPEKKQRRIENQTVLLIISENAFLTEKRPDGGLLAGLMQFPMREGHLTESQVRAWLSELDHADADIVGGPDAKHIFTHVEWHMRSFEVRVRGEVRESGPALSWVDADELDEITLPTAFKKYRQRMADRFKKTEEPQ